MVSLTPPVDPGRNVTPDISCPTVGANCRGIVESSRDMGAIELGREGGFRDEGGSDVGKSKSLPSFGSHDGGVILRAAINHYKAILLVTVDVLAEIEVLAEIVRV